jgi:hypothetical protein
MRIALTPVLLGATACATVPNSSDGLDNPVSWMQGDWRVVSTQEGEVVQPCATAQEFRVSSDRREVRLTERTVDDWSLTYRVVRVESDRVLFITANEDRLTDEGDPVLWWATFEGQDRFRWRRYDWPKENFTNQWQRCD